LEGISSGGVGSGKCCFRVFTKSDQRIAMSCNCCLYFIGVGLPRIGGLLMFSLSMSFEVSDAGSNGLIESSLGLFEG
jgi:hypothetical protein